MWSIARPQVTHACSMLPPAACISACATDTRNPHPAVYRALLDQVRAGAALAVADYPRHWDEANLTNHVARPLIAATTGLDVPQPLAGDLAVSRRALAAAQRAAAELPHELAQCVHGYGIDAFLLLTAATTGPVESVRLKESKIHAGSFDHLPAIFHQAVPVLLHLTATWPLPPAPARTGATVYRATDRTLPPGRVQAMVTALTDLGTGPSVYDGGPWPSRLADAWRAVTSGTAAIEAADHLWPHYLRRVCDWLTAAQHASLQRRAQILTAAHDRLRTDPTSAAGEP
ncbi:hypothetical protein [Streptomyces sp. NBC_00525]|uniref:hypothetical protein n=1 Tax=Streptomyces sp. NBC_00525 TaxID=2903660 RepID=UPI002E801CD5|nr:hypothetical protein [Streptomyces sp. NBC_00525]WUC95371.1 hypothetical protein OG710_18065 [Streptomyces sp. NBC_00525]